MTARRFTVTGRVQGVGFRWFVMHRARSLDLVGWVRNCPDGSVEVRAEGTEDALNALESSLREGPPGAVVKGVEVEGSHATGLFFEFSVSY